MLDMTADCLMQFLLRAVKDWELFCPRTPLIKTVMRLFTAASNYSQLWLCSIDYDSHEQGMQFLLGFLDCSLAYRAMV